MSMNQRKIIVSLVCLFNLCVSAVAFSSASEEHKQQITLPLPPSQALQRSYHEITQGIIEQHFADSSAEQGAETPYVDSDAAELDLAAATALPDDESDDEMMIPRFHTDPTDMPSEQERMLARIGLTPREIAKSLAINGLATPPFVLPAAIPTYLDQSGDEAPAHLQRAQSLQMPTEHDKPLQIMGADDSEMNRKMLTRMVAGRFKKEKLSKVNIDISEDAKQFLERFIAKHRYLANKYRRSNAMIATGQSAAAASSVPSPAQALPAWKGPVAHAIVLDQDMKPGVPGSELAHQIRMYELINGLEFSPIYIWSANTDNNEGEIFKAYFNAFENVGCEGAEMLRAQLWHNQYANRWSNFADIAIRNWGKPTSIGVVAPFLRQAALNVGFSVDDFNPADDKFFPDHSPLKRLASINE